MNISVIIPTLNRLDDLKFLIKSLERQSYLPQEIIIVDQSDHDLVRDYIKNYTLTAPFAVQYLFTQDKSLTRAKNLGIAHLHKACDLVAFFDDDIVLFDNYFGEMRDFFLADPAKRYAVVTGMIQREDNQHNSISSLRSLVRYLDTALCKFFLLSSEGRGCFKINGLSAYCRYSEIPRDVEVISGGVSVFRREILEEFLFDGNMKTYCYMEDVDMGYRISRKYQNAFLPGARVYHHHVQMGRLDIVMTKSQFMQNYFYLFHKNVPKNFLTFSAFIWSVMGLFIVAACELQFRAVQGYARGLIKSLFRRYDSLFPDWRGKMRLYQ